jgi:hypothetical protein
MKLNFSVKPFSTLGQRLTNICLCLVAIAFMGQIFCLNSPAMALPTTLITANPADQIQGAAEEVRDRSKDLIRDTKRNVERTADRNAAKVDRVDDEGTYLENKARRDQARIQKRAEEDAARTEKAVDDSMNAVQGAVENIKDAFSR